MTATAPTPSSSSLASAQSLRRRYGRLSPVRLGVYGLVSLGSHLLLLGLFRWAWQVQLATQPVGSSIGIDFVEVDLSDGSFDGQRPDASGGKLSAAQLNELIAQGKTASGDAIANADPLALGKDTELTAEGRAAAELARVQDAQADSPRANSPRADSPRANGASEGEEFRSGLPDRPALPFPTTPTVQPQPNRDAANNASNAPANDGEASGDGPVASEAGAIAGGSSGDGSLLPSQSSSETDSSATNNSETNSSETNRPASSTGTAASATGGDASEGVGGDGAKGVNDSAGRPNDLPPNMSEQPVSSDQTIQPGETDLPDPSQPDPSQPDPAQPDTTQPSSTQGDAGTAGPPNDGGTNPGSGSGTSGDNTDGESPTPENDTVSSTGSNIASDASDANGSDAVPRLGASLDIDEARSRAQNTQDVVTQLPRPLGDPLSNGSQSANGGQCAAQLASLTPTSYGQPVQLILAVDKTGEVFYAEALEPVQAQTPAGQAAICLARAWPFEPAKREIDEGGVSKIENAGAELVVTVTISLLD